jgi:hypothetical protein
MGWLTTAHGSDAGGFGGWGTCGFSTFGILPILFDDRLIINLRLAVRWRSGYWPSLSSHPRKVGRESTCDCHHRPILITALGGFTRATFGGIIWMLIQLCRAPAAVPRPALLFLRKPRNTLYSGEGGLIRM